MQIKEHILYLHSKSTVVFCTHKLPRKGYPPHDAGVDEGEAEVSHQGHGPIETLQKEDKSHIRQAVRMQVNVTTVTEKNGLIMREVSHTVENTR